MPRKATHQTDRQTISRFDQIINIGSAMTRDFERLGIATPQGLIGQDPLELYRQICGVDNQFHDPCVLDTYMATIEYMNGKRPRTWWSYTPERKKRYAREVNALQNEFVR